MINKQNYKTIKISSLHNKVSYSENLPEKREKIVFILGLDKDKDNQYYQLAKDYYRLNPKNKGTLIIDTCRSLNCVRNFLNENSPNNHIPWGKIDIIVHSNEWTGIGVPVFDDGPRATYELLLKAINQNQFQPLQSINIDAQSTLEIKGCGFGKNKKFVNLLGKALGCNNVSASENFIIYDNTGKYPGQFEAKSYYAYFRTGYRPPDLIMKKQFEKRYPNVNIDWLSALSRKQPEFFGETYHYYFNVPVKWTITYPSKEERPVFNTEEEKIKWIKSCSGLIKSIIKTKIPFDKFRWQIKYKDYIFEDGNTEPAIEINGKSSVMCILKPMEE